MLHQVAAYVGILVFSLSLHLSVSIDLTLEVYMETNLVTVLDCVWNGVASLWG